MKASTHSVRRQRDSLSQLDITLKENKAVAQTQFRMSHCPTSEREFQRAVDKLLTPAATAATAATVATAAAATVFH